VKDGTEKARDLRRDQSSAEKIFWRRVRNRGLSGLKFKRQVPIGPYVADFYADAALLVVELDGDQHGLDEGRARDTTRDAYLRSEGYEVLRIWNRDIYERVADVMDHVLHVALRRIEEIEAADPSPETASRFRPLPRER
jgi:very-short-patch-repair endonuclease